MATRISERDRQDVIRNRKAHFRVTVKDAPPEDKKWGLDAVISFNINGRRDRLLRFSREEIVELTAALTEWLAARTA
jgi:hypothetical protein